MQFKVCCVCGLSLPINVMRPIQVRHQGKLIVVGICDRCREIKEAEAKRRKDEPTY
jgi:hypothetical protein